MHASQVRRSWILLVALLTIAGFGAGASVEAGNRRTYEADWKAFAKEIDKSYPFFDLKDIRKDWKQTKRDVAKQLRRCDSDGAFLLLCLDAVRCLRDAHMTLTPKTAEFPPFPKRYTPGLALLPAEGERVVVMHPPPGRETTLPRGTLVTTIEGKPAREWLDDHAQAQWDAGGYFSSPQRARLFVYRNALEGEKGDSFEVGYMDGNRRKKTKLRCEHEIDGWAHTYNLPAGLERVGRSCFHTQLESGVGYMYWRRIDGSIADGIGAALEAHAEAKGWIVDLRGNSGGGYDRVLLDRMKSLPRPVAVILDAGCISAGETAARDLVNLTDARLFGATTAGSSTSKRVWMFPSGIASVRMSTRSRTGLDRTPIEFHGIPPHVPVEAVPEEVAAGKNSEILRAEAYVLETAAE